MRNLFSEMFVGKPSLPEVNVKVSVWKHKTSQEIFDYEQYRTAPLRNQDTTKSQIKTTGKTVEKVSEIYYHEKNSKKIQNNGVTISSDGLYHPGLYLGKIDYSVSKHSQDSSEVYFRNQNEGVNEAYQMVTPKKHMELSLGDCLKLGRLRFRIVKVYDGKVATSQPSASWKNVRSIALDANQEHPSFEVCKFCLLTTQEYQQASQSDDQWYSSTLISPCKCKGSCSAVHIGCLSQWLQNKITKESHKCCQVSNLKEVECEICKQPLPWCIYYGKKAHYRSQRSAEKRKGLVEKEIPLFKLFPGSEQQPYIILEEIGDDEKENKLLKIKFKEEKLVIGRGDSASVMLNDVSISRKHAQLRLKNNQIFIVDLDSKFGTGVRINDSIKVIRNEKLQVQVGKALIQISLSGGKQNSWGHL